VRFLVMKVGSELLCADAQDVLQRQAGGLLLAAEPTVGPFVIVLGQGRALGK
jgi:hypothetical protein